MIRTIADLGNLKNKRVFLRGDLNVPMQGGKVADDTRIQRLIPTIKLLSEQGAKVIIASHFGRPKNTFDPDLSLAPIADALAERLGKNIGFAVNCVGNRAEESISTMQAGDIILLENLRFHESEAKNTPEFSAKLAALADVYVNDAFSCSHREHASIAGIASLLPSAAGLLLQEEVQHLSHALETPEKPLAVIVGGSKISTKIAVLESLAEKVDHVFIGGGMANTFLAAQGYDMGKSLLEPDHIATAKAILKNAEKTNCTIHLPCDAVLATELKAHSETRAVRLDHISAETMMLDVGTETIIAWGAVLQNCKTIIWNGPVGAYEFPPFDTGSISLGRLIASLTASKQAVSIAGGGDVLAALGKAGLKDSLTYVSTAGGAFLEWLEGKELPGISPLKAAQPQAA